MRNEKFSDRHQLYNIGPMLTLCMMDTTMLVNIFIYLFFITTRDKFRENTNLVYEKLTENNWNSSRAQDAFDRFIIQSSSHYLFLGKLRYQRTIIC